MELKDPIAAYNAASNIEALQVADYLTTEGIDAYATQDESLAGNWLGGSLPEIHKPQVGVSRHDSDAAARLLADFETRKRAANAPKKPAAEVEGDLQVTCEDCGKTSAFAAKLSGTVQRCPKCWSHIDVGDLGWGDFDFGEPE